MAKWNFGPRRLKFSGIAWVLLTGVLGLASAEAVPSLPHTPALVFSRDTATSTLCAKVESTLSEHNFAALDSTEVAMRNPDVRLVGGNSQLYHYYGALAAVTGEDLFSCVSQLSFDQKRQLLEKWITADPQSTAAHIALSQFWTNAAWNARGDKYADQVTAEQWNALSTDLAKAQAALAGVNGRADPHLYYVLIEIARGQPDPRLVLDKLYSSAIKTYPNYFHYYSHRATMLEERWYGEPGELKSYAASLLQSPGGDAGLVAYAYVTFILMQTNERSTVLQVTGLSWPTIKLAYATRERLFGLRNRDWNALLNLSLAAIDPVTAKAALNKVNGQWDPAIWGERQYFDSAVSWTLQSQK